MQHYSFPASAPAVPAPLDPGFVPPALANRAYRAALAPETEVAALAVAVERENGLVTRKDIEIFPPGSPRDAETFRVVERHVKFLLWAYGGWKLTLAGPDAVCAMIRGQYRPGGERSFDVDLMQRIYEKPFTVETVPIERVPAGRAAASRIGRHMEGCRIGFDLGASDYKIAAVMDGKPVFSAEIPWNPVVEPDPDYHYTRLTDGLKQAASHLPRVDAVGGSSAGIYIDNRVKVASLFRAVPRETFQTAVRAMFLRIREEFGVPLVVVNDGDVTALAGAMSLGKNAMLGIAMGSSEAAGYLDRQGHITGWLNELAFAPVDFDAGAEADEWSGDIGVGAMYFSQQAVNRLAPAAGIVFPEDMPLPARLKAAQRRADDGDPAAERIFSTIGVYLGYTLPHYADYYDFENVLVLGRVTSGRGGEILVNKAREVLAREFPELEGKVTLHVPDEKSRRVGQAVAAASLPEIRGETE